MNTQDMIQSTCEMARTLSYWVYHSEFPQTEIISWEAVVLTQDIIIHLANCVEHMLEAEHDYNEVCADYDRLLGG